MDLAAHADAFHQGLRVAAAAAGAEKLTIEVVDNGRGIGTPTT